MADYYRHFKGGKYKLLGIAKDSDTLEKMVVYQALYGEGEMWVRPYDMFFGTVERDGKEIYQDNGGGSIGEGIKRYSPV